MKLILVGCGKIKYTKKYPAKELYTGRLFRLGRAYAEKFGDDWGILSAAHGILRPDQVIEPYDITMADKNRDEIYQWATWCQSDFAQWLTNHPQCLIPGSGRVRERVRPELEIIVLAGKAYIEPLEKWTAMRGRIQDPLKGLGIGERLRWLKGQVEEGVLREQQ